MSKLSIHWNRLYERNYICPYNNAYKCSPYKRKMTHQTADLPIRLQNISHLRKLGENDIQLCTDCKSCKCKCLWSKASMNSSNNQQHIHRSKFYPQSQIHNQNGYNSYFCNYRKQFFRGSPERNDSVTWIMQPIKKMHASQTNVMEMKRFLRSDTNFNRSLYSCMTGNVAGADSKITKEYFNQRRRKLLEIIDSRQKSKQQQSEIEGEHTYDSNRKRCLERTNSLRRQHTRLEQLTGRSTELSKRVQTDRRKCKSNVHSNVTGFTTSATTDDDCFCTLNSSTSRNRRPHHIDSLEELELKTLKAYYANISDTDDATLHNDSDHEHWQKIRTLQPGRERDSSFFRSTYRIPKTDANRDPKITVKNILRDSTNTMNDVWPHQPLLLGSKCTLQTSCDVSENETALHAKLSTESCRSSSSAATLNKSVTNQEIQYLTGSYNKRQSYHKSMQRLEQTKNEVDYHMEQKNCKRKYANENIRMTEGKQENASMVKKLHSQLSQSVAPTTKHVTVSKQIIPKSITSSKIIIKQHSQKSIQNNAKQQQTIRRPTNEKPLPKMVSSTTNTENALNANAIKNINVNFGSPLPINTFITPVWNSKKLSSITEQPSVYLIGTDERLQDLAFSKGKTQKSSNANKRKLNKNNSKATQPNKQSKGNNRKNAKNLNRNLSITDTKDRVESENMNNSKKLKNRRNRKMSATPKIFEAALSTIRNDNIENDDHNNNCDDNYEMEPIEIEEKPLEIVEQIQMEKDIDTRLPTIKEIPSAMHILDSVKTPIPTFDCSIAFHMPLNLKMFMKSITPDGRWHRKRLML